MAKGCSGLRWRADPLSALDNRCRPGRGVRVPARPSLRTAFRLRYSLGYRAVLRVVAGVGGYGRDRSGPVAAAGQPGFPGTARHGVGTPSRSTSGLSGTGQAP